MQKSVRHNHNSPHFIIRNAANVIPNVQEIIREILPNSWVEAAEIAPKIFKKNSQQSELEICRAIWNYTKANFLYKEDPVGIEYIRYVSKSLEDAQKGIDCEDFCIIGSSLLSFKNVKHYFKIIKYVPDPNNPKSASEVKEWRHIYLIVKIGNKEIILDSCADKFNDDSVNQYIAEQRLFEIPQFRKNQHKGLSGIVKYNHFGMKSEIINPVSDPNWAKILYDQPTNNDIEVFEKYLKKHQDSFVLMYHGTSPKYDILNQGIKVTSEKRRNSIQSTAGFVYLTPLPSYAKSYGQYANGHTKKPIIYQVKILVSLLLPDLDNLKNQELYGGLKIVNSLANSLSFAHSCRVKGNIPPYLLAVHEGKKGLGVLEKGLWSGREQFIIDLWQQMVRDGVKWLKSSGQYFVTLNENVTENNFGEYLKKHFPDFEVVFKPQEIRLVNLAVLQKYVQEERTIDASYMVKKDNFSIPINIYNMATLVFKIAGEAGLNYIPDKKVVGKYEISPYNDALMKFMTPFVSKNELRPAMMGVSFDDNGAVATDGHRLILIKYKNQEEARKIRGIYQPKTLKFVDERYPNYPDAIPNNQPYFAEMDLDEMMAGVKAMKNFTNKSTHQLTLFFTADQVIISAEDLDYDNGASYPLKCRSNAIKRTFGVNAKFFLESLDFLKKMKLKKVKLYFSEYNKAILMHIDTDFGKAIFLNMPIMLNDEYGKPLERIINIEGFSKYKDTSPPDLNKGLIVSQGHKEFKAEQLRDRFKSDIEAALRKTIA